MRSTKGGQLVSSFLAEAANIVGSAQVCSSPQMLLWRHQAMPSVRLRGPSSTGNGVGCPGLNRPTSGELQGAIAHCEG